ncbi:MAG: cation-transporting P-type ATPase, partial [Oscillospiraceae bacterium]
MKHYCTDIEGVLAETKSTREGLSSQEAQKRLEENGKNKLAQGKKDSIIKRFLKQMADPMIIILIVAAVISGI